MEPQPTELKPTEPHPHNSLDILAVDRTKHVHAHLSKELREDEGSGGDNLKDSVVTLANNTVEPTN